MKRLALLLLLVVIGLGIAGERWLRAIPVARSFAPPPPTSWAPHGPRSAAANRPPALPAPIAFHAMHVDSMNGDEVWSAVGPAFELEWTAEPEMYVAEGPTFDATGNLYFSPISPKEDVSLVALDARTGERRWTVPGAGMGCGAPLVLNDPERAGEQTIFHSTYTTAMALRPDGSTLWSVPTGLTLPAREPGVPDQTHVWGMNYHPQTDSVFAVTMDGQVYAQDRRTGAPILQQPFRLPGAPAKIQPRPPAWVRRLADAETDRAFGPRADGDGLFTLIYDVIFGSGVQVANFYAIDSNTGRLYIAATAADEQDGTADGVSQNGALYRLDLSGDKPGHYGLRVAATYTFDGGTGSTPTVSTDGTKVVVSDDNGNVIALDADLQELWRLNVGSQVAASIAVAADNDEMFAVTRYDILKLVDRGSSAEIAWRARLDAYPGFDNFNALTPTIAANGIVVSVAGGRMIGGQQLMSKFGMGLLDRETGELRWFAEGREESIAVSATGPDGAIYTAGSPVRRAIARAVFGDALPPLVGGIHRYRPTRPDLLARDAVCAAAARAQRLARTDAANSASRRDDVLQIGVLLRQAKAVSPKLPGQTGAALDAAPADLERAAGAAAALEQLCRKLVS
jgi:outer membrane protein assembly factor BamB